MLTNDPWICTATLWRQSTSAAAAPCRPLVEVMHLLSTLRYLCLRVSDWTGGKPVLPFKGKKDFLNDFKGLICDSGKRLLIFECNSQSNYNLPFRAPEATCWLDCWLECSPRQKRDYFRNKCVSDELSLEVLFHAECHFIQPFPFFLILWLANSRKYQQITAFHI